LLVAFVAHGLEEVIVCLDEDAQVDAEKVYRKLQRRVPKVRVLKLDHGDPFDRRDELAALIQTATTPSVADQVANRIRRKRS
jgi:hypothetical protein